MKISIVIPAFNEEKYIKRTIQSIQNMDVDSYDIELLVVDGGSTDTTAQIARDNGAKVVTIPHRGIGYARQQGLHHATGDIVAFTDADTIVPANWIRLHVEALLGQNVVFSYGTFHVSDGEFPYYHYINYIQPYLIGFAYYILHTPIAPGQNMAFWKDKALKIKGFNERLLIMEDIDMSVRMKTIGKVIFLPNCTVHSSGRRSSEGWKFFSRASTATLQYFLFRKKDLTIFPDYR